MLNSTNWWYKVDHLIVSLVYVLVVWRPSNDVRPPLSVCHLCFLHVEPSTLYLQWVGDQQCTRKIKGFNGINSTCTTDKCIIFLRHIIFVDLLNWYSFWYDQLFCVLVMGKSLIISNLKIIRQLISKKFGYRNFIIIFLSSSFNNKSKTWYIWVFLYVIYDLCGEY